jgi:hypothetical protein
MPSLDPRRRRSNDRQGAVTPHRCTTCREHLQLVRTHVSPTRLGEPLTTEFYQCGACDSGFAFNPLTGTWKNWAADEV